MTLAHRLQRRWHLVRAAIGAEPTIQTWWFVVGEDGQAVQDVARRIVAREAVCSVPFPACDYQNELPRPATHRHTHTWGIDPVHYALEASDVGMNADRLRRQWAQYAGGRAAIVVADPVNSLRIPWLAAHFPGARFVHATLPQVDAIAWLRARSGLPAPLAAEHIGRIRTILQADLANVPHETLTALLPATPLVE